MEKVMKYNICFKCKHLVEIEEGRYGCEKNLHKSYEPIFECDSFEQT